MNWRHFLGLAILILLAILLAPTAAVLFQELLLEPIAYLWWLFKLVLGAVPELFLWYLLSSITALVAIGSLLRSKGLLPQKKGKSAHKKGPVQLLGESIAYSKRGPYFKWAVANRLAKTAHKILIHQKGEANVRADALEAQGWNPPQEVGTYLNAGFRKSILEYHRRRFFNPPIETPFDTDLDRVIAYLESQMEWQE